MKLVISLLCIVLCLACNDGKEPIRGNSEFQRKLNSEFKNASKSPLEKSDLKTFKGLDFFPIDSTFSVKAYLEQTPGSKWFNMKTNTDRISRERVYGKVHFKLKDNYYTLNVYQGEENLETEGMEDYLFLPFMDDTNGKTTYGGGRYIDLRIPLTDSLTVDFNTAYSPYCAYNEKFSCPIVPRTNYLPIDIEAGVMKFRLAKP